MNRGAVKALAIGQAVTAALLVVVVVVFTGQMGEAREEVNALRVELADTRSRLVQAEADRDRLQERVDALTRALLLAGVDPNTIPTEPSMPEPEAGPPPSSTAAPQSPAARSDSPRRPATTQPDRSPPPEQSAPPPPPPQDEPTPPGPLPPQTCDLLPTLCS